MFTELNNIMVLTKDGDWNGGFTADSVDMANFDHLTILLVGDSSVSGNGVVTIYGGLTNASQGAAITFKYRVTSVAVGTTGSDVYGAASTSAALTTTGASLGSQYNYVFEIDAEDLNISGTQYRFVTLVVSADGAAGTVDVIAIGSKARVAKTIMATGV